VQCTTVCHTEVLGMFTVYLSTKYHQHFISYGRHTEKYV